ncbi:MAG: sulfatase-like hydrolase/transferase [Acidobacteria bacterium]|nr:sulfatase-like hydrolase/transferase [Acidobacteriota bacterium]NIM62404.1 sulfatase-like hydrolase/transferase [Acidobacteriota bacterium]NIO60698.1 sulfatase-like hydrolase/transferase [Acidobacteriota bacterium]NIQ31763.1 sulfatase-like hydrolase/transferase [Acidobacteriota bacterium]NIQ87069.1 sulfatase-like hydrolase/transferase [Acidobacteriota bacterium]
MRNPRYGFTTILVLLIAALVPVAGAAEEDLPNVVLITLDTTRADRLGCYGGDGVSTPAIDALAREGVRFDQAQSPAPLTVPAHASLMSGLVPRRHGARDNARYPVGRQVALLPEYFKARGYRTAAFVSSALLDRRAGFNQKFDLYDDTVRIGPGEASNDEERAATQTNEAVLAWLPGTEAPFFLWVHYFDPHLPYVPPDPFAERFEDRPYDGEIAFMDEALGELVNRIRSRFPETLIVVAGDHGESLGEHGEQTHGVFLYQVTQRVPLIFFGPGIPRGRVVSERVGLVDVMPTLLDLTRFELPTDLDGRSLVPLLRGKTKKWKRRAYEMESLFPQSAYDWAPLRGWVLGDLVAIDAPRPELYDLATDPKQQNNLGADHAKAEPLLGEGYARNPVSGIDPKDGIHWLGQIGDARTAVQLGRAADAIEPLKRLLERNPGNVPARLTLASAQLATGDPTAAVASARTALDRNPDDDLIRFSLANALWAESPQRPSARREAREQYEAVLRINPRRAEAYLNYASLLVDAGEVYGARALLARAEESGIDGPDLASRRASVELLLGQRDAAIRYFEHALELDPESETAAEALKELRDPGDF